MSLEKLNHIGELSFNVSHCGDIFMVYPPLTQEDEDTLSDMVSVLPKNIYYSVTISNDSTTVELSKTSLDSKEYTFKLFFKKGQLDIPRMREVNGLYVPKPLRKYVNKISNLILGKNCYNENKKIFSIINMI